MSSETRYHGVRLTDYRRALQWEDANNHPATVTCAYPDHELILCLNAGQTERNRANKLIQNWTKAGQPIVQVAR